MKDPVRNKIGIPLLKGPGYTSDGKIHFSIKYCTPLGSMRVLGHFSNSFNLLTGKVNVLGRNSKS